MTDSSSSEQVVVCIRWIDEDFKAHEDFVRPYKVESTTADILVIVLNFLAHNLSITNC